MALSGTAATISVARDVEDVGWMVFMVRFFTEFIIRCSLFVIARKVSQDATSAKLFWSAPDRMAARASSP